MRARLVRSSHRDQGFTLVEVILAMVIVATLMTAVLGATMSTLSTLAQARQRQSGSALATEALESLRALPYRTVTAGAPTGCDSALGLAATATYVNAGPPATFSPPSALLSVPTEALIVNTQSPCVRTVLQGATTFKIYQYVTKSSSSDGFNLTAIATWTKQGSGDAASSVERSQTFSPAGCLLDTLHPFSGPCQAAFSAGAGSDSMSLTVTQVDPLMPDTVIAPVGGLTLPAANSSLEVEQTVSLTSTGVGAGAHDAAGGGVMTVEVREANSDPTSGSVRSYSASPTISGGTLSPGPASFSASSSSVELVGDIAATTAVCQLPTATSSQPVATGPPGALRPCDRTKVSGPGNATATLSGQALLSADGISSRAGTGNITGVANAGLCGAATPGCVRSASARTIDLLSFIPGAGTDGLVKMTTLKEYAVAEKGTGASAPSASRTGTVAVWTGAAYDTIALSPTSNAGWSWGAAPSTYPAITTPGGLTITGSLTITSGGASTTGPGACDTAACVTTQKSGSIVGSFFVTSPDGMFRVDLAVGGVSAVAGYQAAPVG